MSLDHVAISLKSISRHGVEIRFMAVGVFDRRFCCRIVRRLALGELSFQQLFINRAVGETILLIDLVQTVAITRFVRSYDDQLSKSITLVVDRFLF